MHLGHRLLQRRRARRVPRVALLPRLLQPGEGAAHAALRLRFQRAERERVRGALLPQHALVRRAHLRFLIRAERAHRLAQRRLRRLARRLQLGARVGARAARLLEGEVRAPPLLGALVDEPRELPLVPG